jgi:hypothetical protein
MEFPFWAQYLKFEWGTQIYRGYKVVPRIFGAYTRLRGRFARTIVLVQLLHHESLIVCAVFHLLDF